MKTIKYKTTTIHYRVFGNGNPLVFLHGFLEDSTMWDEFVKPLAENNQIILIDLPCHGETRFVGEVCSMRFMAECVSAVLEQENIKSPTVFGHSMGGYVGLELAKMTDIKLTLVHSNFWADSIEKQGDRDRVVEIVNNKKEFFIQEAIPSLFYKINKVNCLNTINLLIKKANNISKDEISAATLGMKLRNANHILLDQQKINIIQGEHDSIITASKLNEELKKLILDQKVSTIKACGHMSIWEKPEQLFNIIQQFC